MLSNNNTQSKLVSPPHLHRFRRKSRKRKRFNLVWTQKCLILPRFVCLSVCVCPSVCLSVYICLYLLCLLSFCVLVWSTISYSHSLPLFPFAICLSIRLSVYLPSPLFVCWETSITPKPLSVPLFPSLFFLCYVCLSVLLLGNTSLLPNLASYFELVDASHVTPINITTLLSCRRGRK